MSKCKKHGVSGEAVYDEDCVCNVLGDPFSVARDAVNATASALARQPNATRRG